MKVTVKVTEAMADPANGPGEDAPDYGERCMVAQAVRPILRGDVAVWVTGTSLDIIPAAPAHTESISLSNTEIRRISVYDSGESPGPFDFELDIPARFLRDPERK